jgi:vancomycin permeability regulator SanA
LTWPWRRFPKTVGGATGLFAVLCFVVVGSNAYILLTTGGEATSDVADVPPAEVAIVPGALVNANGRMSRMLGDRVKEASRLWHDGKVKKILVSGDHGTWAYDEPDTMRKALVRDGVAPRDIFEDHAGFDTWATMVRARSIFDVHDAVVVTQGFHMPRALYLAEEAGMHVTGLLADQHRWGYQGERSEIREVFSRVKAIWDTTVDTPAMAGPRIPIQTSDGRESWGPAPPPGTPPAGSPDSRTAAAHLDRRAAEFRRGHA